MTRLNAYLRFDGNCREALEFYRDCFGAELKLTPVGESQMAGDMPAGLHNQILHGELTKGDIVLMGADVMGMEKLVTGNNVALCLVCTSKEDIQTYFAKLSVGAQVHHELREEFFGTYGDLTDKFGLSWMFQMT
ncbi:MAG TPA: VOC family protein [Phototrophicaceae bacterium]|jgi:PhnB protein|nr:VOC family protein [Phototrophicaceae bacterium]